VFASIEVTVRLAQSACPKRSGKVHTSNGVNDPCGIPSGPKVYRASVWRGPELRRGRTSKAIPQLSLSDGPSWRNNSRVVFAQSNVPCSALLRVPNTL
jgi:hypothetical protein